MSYDSKLEGPKFNPCLFIKFCSFLGNFWKSLEFFGDTWNSLDSNWKWWVGTVKYWVYLQWHNSIPQGPQVAIMEGTG